MTRLLFRAILGASAGLAGLSLFSFLNPAYDVPAFVLSDTERDLGSQPVGKSIFAFDITNRSTVPRRILGFAEG